MPRSRGFTLLELMIVIVIAAVLLTLAVPSIRSLLLNSRRAEASTSLYGGLVTAHSEAIIRNTPITVCRRAVGTTGGFPQCALTGGSWTDGWVAFVETSTSGGTNGPANAASIIAVGDPTDSAFNITTNTSSALPFLQFQSSGRASFSNASSTLTFTLCKTADSTVEGRLIQVDLNGRVGLNKFTACPSS